MGRCKGSIAKPNCDRQSRPGHNTCNECDPSKKSNAKDNKEAKKKADELAETARKEALRTQAFAAAQALRLAAEQRVRDRAAAVATQATANCAFISALAHQVRQLRLAHPLNSNINAGENRGLATIIGGSNNPYRIVGLATAPAGEVLSKMRDDGFLENSDSGLLKHRTADDIFIHVGT